MDLAHCDWEREVAEKLNVKAKVSETWISSEILSVNALVQVLNALVRQDSSALLRYRQKLPVQV